jgi:hypothetical protein
MYMDLQGVYTHEPNSTFSFIKESHSNDKVVFESKDFLVTKNDDTIRLWFYDPVSEQCRCLQFTKEVALNTAKNIMRVFQ